jgi:hypothetical protein
MSRTVQYQRRGAVSAVTLLVALFTVLSMVAATPAYADFSEDERFALLDGGDDGQRAAYVHGDHWHGSLSVVPLGEHLSLGAEIRDDDGGELILDGSPFSLGVALASGADDGIVEFDDHGDHVHVRGESEGETTVVFRLLDGDDVEYETPPMTVVVSADPDAHGGEGDHEHSHGDDDHGHGDDDHGHSHADDHDEAPVGGVDAGFGGVASAGPSTTTLLLVGMVSFALMAVAVAVRPVRSTATSAR